MSKLERLKVRQIDKTLSVVKLKSKAIGQVRHLDKLGNENHANEQVRQIKS